MRLLIAAAFAAATIGCSVETVTPRIELDRKTGTIVVSDLSARDLDRLRQETLSKEEWVALLAIHSGAPDAPAMLGSYEVTADTIVFRPRFPLVPGLPYNVRFDPSRLGHTGSPIQTIVTLPKPPTTATTIVAHVYPSGDELPANQLKFYLDFSAPMSTGDAYRHIHLLDETGKEVPRAFLMTAHELWDERRQRFTLILDPGRIKRGLRSNLEDGVPLQPGREYRLTIDADWRDGDGNALREAYEKRFRVVDDDRTSPDHRTWRLHTPAASTTEPLRIELNEPLDRALLEDMLIVLDEHAQPVAGKIEITNAETQWLFRPSQPWRRGTYAVHVNAKLEDRAGNNLQRLFDEDVSKTTAQANVASAIELPFTIP